jgi:hypothetical protein
MCSTKRQELAWEFESWWDGVFVMYVDEKLGEEEH